MNVLYRTLADFANAVVAAWRWIVGVHEGPGYEGPVVTHHQVTVEAQAAAWAFPTPVGKLSQWTDAAYRRPTVDLSKPERQPNLVRAYVRAIGRAAVTVASAPAPVLVDALGLPLNERLSTSDTPTVGVFEQTLAAFVRRTGISSGDRVLATA